MGVEEPAIPVEEPAMGVEEGDFFQYLTNRSSLKGLENILSIFFLPKFRA
jgi:hypothetical protein